MIRHDFIKCQGSMTIAAADPNPPWSPLRMSDEMGIPALGSYLEKLDEAQLNRVLDEVLTECRKREADKLKKDILTHSQSLRLKNPIR